MFPSSMPATLPTADSCPPACHAPPPSVQHWRRARAVCRRRAVVARHAHRAACCQDGPAGAVCHPPVCGAGRGPGSQLGNQRHGTHRPRVSGSSVLAGCCPAFNSCCNACLPVAAMLVCWLLASPGARIGCRHCGSVRQRHNASKGSRSKRSSAAGLPLPTLPCICPLAGTSAHVR